MKLIADRAAEPSWRCLAWSGGFFAHGRRWFAQRRSSRRSGWSGRDRPSRSRGRQRRTSRYTEQPPALARANAPRFSNVGSSADVHRRAAVGELVVLRVTSTLTSEVDRGSCSRAELALRRLVGRIFRAGMASVRPSAQFAMVRVVGARQTLPESWSATQNQSLHRTAASRGASRCGLVFGRRIVSRRSPPGVCR